jgi:hypothetical protein
MKNVETFDDLNMGCASAMDAKAWIDNGVGEIVGEENPSHPGEEIVENPPKIDALKIYREVVLPMRKGEMKDRSIFTPEFLNIHPGNMLGTSAKLDEAKSFGWYTPGLYLASGRLSGYGDACPYASDMCRKSCLIVSGNRALDKQIGNDSAKSALLISDLLRGHDAQGNIVRGSLGPSSTLSLAKSWLKEFNEKEFCRILDISVEKNMNYASNHVPGLSYGVRLNATSDLAWERFPANRLHTIHKYAGGLERGQDPENLVFFYDYTKDFRRMMRFCEGGGPAMFTGLFETMSKFRSVPMHERRLKLVRSRGGKKKAMNPEELIDKTIWPFDNYYLNFSYSEINLAWCMIFLSMGGNIVVPFDQSIGMIEPHTWEFDTTKVRKSELPTTFLGYPVIDGDAYDMRFMDNEYWSQRLGVEPPFVVGLRVKGQYQQKNTSNENDPNRPSFFVSAVDAEENSRKPERQVELLRASVEECIRQTTGRRFDPRTGPVNPHEKLPSPDLFKEWVPDLYHEYVSVYKGA